MPVHLNILKAVRSVLDQINAMAGREATLDLFCQTIGDSDVLGAAGLVFPRGLYFRNYILDHAVGFSCALYRTFQLLDICTNEKAT